LPTGKTCRSASGADGIAIRCRARAARVVLARARWESGRDRVRAREEAARAQADSEKAGPSAAANLTEIVAWRRVHPG
jgi:hypothetical protein